MGATVKIVEHRRHGDGQDALYRLVAHLGEREETTLTVDGEKTVVVPILRVFEWGPIPLVPETADLAAASEAYAAIHGRDLKPGDRFVTEKEYVALQLYEALETIEAEAATTKAGKKLSGEGLEI